MSGLDNRFGVFEYVCSLLPHGALIITRTRSDRRWLPVVTFQENLHWPPTAIVYSFTQTEVFLDLCCSGCRCEKTAMFTCRTALWDEADDKCRSTINPWPLRSTGELTLTVSQERAAAQQVSCRDVRMIREMDISENTGCSRDEKSTWISGTLFDAPSEICSWRVAVARRLRPEAVQHPCRLQLGFQARKDQLVWSSVAALLPVFLLDQVLSLHHQLLRLGKPWLVTE